MHGVYIYIYIWQSSYLKILVGRQKWSKSGRNWCPKNDSIFRIISNECHCYFFSYHGDYLPPCLDSTLVVRKLFFLFTYSFMFFFMPIAEKPKLP